MNRRRKILIAVGVIFGIVILVPVIRHYQLKAAVNRYRAELKAKGEPLELAQVIPQPLPHERNCAPIFLKAASLLATNFDVLSSNPPMAMHGVTPGKAAVAWQQPEIRDEKETNSWKDIKEALDRNVDALNLLMQMTNSSLFDFDLQYARRFEMRLTHLSLEKKSAQRLATKTIYDLHLKNSASAAKAISAIFVLVNGTDDERTAISQLVRIAVAQIGIAATWELLQSPDLADNHLANLQAEMSQMEFVRAELKLLLVEREGAESSLNKWRNSSSELDKYFAIMKQVHEAMGNPVGNDTLWNKTQLQAKKIMWRYWWSYSDELRSLKGYEVLMGTVRSIETNKSFQTPLSVQINQLDQFGISKLDSSLNKLFSGEMDFHSMMSESVVTLGNVTLKVMRVEVAKEIAVTAIALKRFQLKHGNLPEKLSELTPEFLAAVPRDPVDGQPLRYRRNADGSFLLYSVGEDGKDDGGDARPPSDSKSRSWQLGRDWVWPQPMEQN